MMNLIDENNNIATVSLLASNWVDSIPTCLSMIQHIKREMVNTIRGNPTRDLIRTLRGRKYPGKAIFNAMKLRYCTGLCGEFRLQQQHIEVMQCLVHHSCAPWNAAWNPEYIQNNRSNKSID